MWTSLHGQNKMPLYLIIMRGMLQINHCLHFVFLNLFRTEFTNLQFILFSVSHETKALKQAKRRENDFDQVALSYLYTALANKINYRRSIKEKFKNRPRIISFARECVVNPSMVPNNSLEHYFSRRIEGLLINWGKCRC